uniref:Uncharacterized protein n=1 Tax=Panagrolaimus sp. ES5 TaxID=591445 RepID=A0AC34G8I5_9BILA
MLDFTIATINECSKNDAEIYGFAQVTKEWRSPVLLTIYGAQSKKDVGQIACGRDTFLMEFIKVFKDSKLKAFIFRIHGTSENADFIRLTRINLELLKMPFVYFTVEEQMRSAILVTANLTLNAVLNNVPSSKLLVMEEDLDQYDEKCVFETVKWIFDKSYTKFYVCQLSFRNYMVRVKYGDKNYPLIICKKEEVLPFKQEVTIPKSFLEFTNASTDHNDIDIIDYRTMEIPKEVHALKVLLEIDASNFMFAYVRGIIFNKFSRLPAQLDAKKFNVPVIGFYGELSFIYLKDENGSYKLLDSWNGMYLYYTLTFNDLFFSVNLEKIFM